LSLLFLEAELSICNVAYLVVLNFDLEGLICCLNGEHLAVPLSNYFIEGSSCIPLFKIRDRDCWVDLKLVILEAQESLDFSESVIIY
jgi:hypothetical protein